MARTRGRNMLQNSNSQTNQTYSSNYPGLNESSYRKMESAVDQMGLSGQQRTQAMNNYYQSNAKYLLNDQLLDERDNYINEQAYQAANLQDPNANAQLRMTQASQRAKRQWNLRADANDLDVFSDIVESLGSDGMDLAGQYLAGENNELLFAAGLKDRIETPEAPESSVGGIQSIINKESEIKSDTPAGKLWNAMDWINIVGKTTQGIDNLVQRIPVIDGQSQVENLANKMNNLTDDEIGNLYQRYTRMIKNGTADKWRNDDRNVAELIWDGLINGDQEAIDRVNTLRMADYSEALKQDGIERNQWGDQLMKKIDPTNQMETINEDDLSFVQKTGKNILDYGTNLLNFIGGSWGGLENYADALGVATVEGKDLLKGNYFVPQKGQLENDEDAFKAYVANQTANFGEYLMDAPDALLGQRVSPNVGKMIVNTPASFLKTLSSKVRGATNPLDSKIGLLKMIFTDEGQQAMINRYGTIDNIANTMNTDPVGLASDMVDWADKINRAANKVSGGNIARQNIGDVTDVMAGDITKRINVGLNKTSDWLNNKGWNKTAGATDIITDAAFNPGNLANDVTREAGMIAKDVSEIPADIQNRAKERANTKLQNINRMTKKQQETFKKMSGGIDQGEFQNQRGLKNTEDLANYLTKNLEQVDTAMETIQGKFKSPALDAVVDETLTYALDTEDPRAGRMQELYNKNKEGGLEMSEINEVKRYYERTNMFDYLKDTAGSKKARTATNRDTALREWQYKTAEEAGLDNLPALNKETQLTKYLLDNATKRQSGVKGNNDISLTDWIVASGGGLDAAGIASLVGKKVYQSNRFQEKLVDVYNYIGGRELIDTPTVDMNKIQQSNIDRAILAQELANVKTEQQFNQWLEKAQAMAGPALPYNPAYDGEPTTTIRVTPEGQSIRQGQIAESPVQNVNYVKQQLKEMGVSDEQIQRVVREIEAKNATQEGLFQEVDKGRESEGLNPEVLSTKDLRKMDDLNNVTSALNREDKADYISHRIAEDKGINRLGTDDEMDRFANISADVENMMDDFEYGGNEAAKTRSEHLFPGENAESIINRYTKRYNSDLKDYNRLKERYKGYENGKFKLG